MKRLAPLLLATIPLVTPLVSPLAFAQEAGQAPKELEQVTVTATKQSTSYEKVMASVSSIDSKFILERGASNFQELTDYTPNVTISVSGSASQFIVRGLGTPDTNAGFDPSVGTVADGVYYGRGNFLSAFFNDLDKFEVLRGPQGTLFGKNSTAGLFNVVTNKPGNKLKFDGQMIARGYGDISLRPALSVPITSNFGVRLSANFQNGNRGTLYNTFLNRPEENEAQSAVRLRSRWVGEGGVVVDSQVFSAHYTKNNSGFVLTTLQPGMRRAIVKYDPNYSNVVDDRLNSTDFPSAEAAVNQGFSTTVEAPLPGFIGISNVRLTSISAYARSRAKHRDIDADFTPIPFISDKLVVPQTYTQLSQELRLTGDVQSFFGHGYGANFITGVYLGNSAYKASDQFTLESYQGAIDYCSSAEQGNANCNGIVPGGAGGVAGAVSGPLATLIQQLGPGLNNQNVKTVLDQKGHNVAVFGQFEYNFFPTWALIGGMRYGVEHKEALLSALASSDIVKQIAGSDNHTTFLSRDEQDFSPKGGIRWTPSKRISSYFTWARGFKSGGYNGLPLRQTQNEYGPERASSYEFGTKLRTNKNRLRFSTSFFYTNFDNLQVSTFQNNRFIVLNAAAAKSQGAEMDIQWLPEAVPFVFLRASAGFTDATYSDYKNGPCYADATAGQGKCRSDNAQDLTGQRLPYGSRWTASVTPNVFFPLGNGLLGTIGIDWLYRSNRYLDVDLDPRKLQAASNVYNGLFSVGDASRKWAVTFSARNITNQKYYDQRIGQPLAPGNFASNGLNEERTYSQSISYSF